MEFHVHVDASCIALGIVLAQPGAGEIDHPIAFASKKLSKAGKNYSTTEEKMVSYGICITEVQALLVGSAFQDVHQSLWAEIFGE